MLREDAHPFAAYVARNAALVQACTQHIRWRRKAAAEAMWEAAKGSSGGDVGGGERQQRRRCGWGRKAAAEAMWVGVWQPRGAAQRTHVPEVAFICWNTHTMPLWYTARHAQQHARTHARHTEEQKRMPQHCHGQ